VKAAHCCLRPERGGERQPLRQALGTLTPPGQIIRAT
jgi:hypothetical protein